MKRRVVWVLGLVVAVCIVAVGVLYLYGTPQSSPPAAQAAPAAEPPAPMPPDPNTPLAIEIPGCRCHSDDAKVVKRHEAYRMNQCAGCHGGQTPTGVQ